jgi:hypothetical protein
MDRLARMLFCARVAYEVNRALRFYEGKHLPTWEELSESEVFELLAFAQHLRDYPEDAEAIRMPIDPVILLAAVNQLDSMPIHSALQ